MISLLEKIILKKRNIKDILITSLDEGNFATYTKYAKYAFFESWLKTTFLCVSDDFKHFLFFSLKFFSAT